MNNAELIDMFNDPDMGGCYFSYGRIVETVNNKGRAEQTVQAFPAQGNIQPAPGRERELLPEEDRAKESIIIYTAALLTAGGGETKADRIYYADGVYRVSLAEPWREHGGFTKAVAVLESDNE